MAIRETALRFCPSYEACGPFGANCAVSDATPKRTKTKADKRIKIPEALQAGAVEGSVTSTNRADCALVGCDGLL